MAWMWASHRRQTRPLRETPLLVKNVRGLSARCLPDGSCARASLAPLVPEANLDYPNHLRKCRSVQRWAFCSNMHCWFEQPQLRFQKRQLRGGCEAWWAFHSSSGTRFGRPCRGSSSDRALTAALWVVADLHFFATL